MPKLWNEEETVKPCLQIFVRCLKDKNIERKVDKIAVKTVMRYTKELSWEVSMQLKDLINAFTFFSLGLDKSVDICETTQLIIFYERN